VPFHAITGTSRGVASAAKAKLAPDVKMQFNEFKTDPDMHPTDVKMTAPEHKEFDVITDHGRYAKSVMGRPRKRTRSEDGDGEYKPIGRGYIYLLILT